MEVVEPNGANRFPSSNTIGFVGFVAEITITITKFLVIHMMVFYSRWRIFSTYHVHTKQIKWHVRLYATYAWFSLFPRHGFGRRETRNSHSSEQWRATDINDGTMNRKRNCVPYTHTHRDIHTYKLQTPRQRKLKSVTHAIFRQLSHTIQPSPIWKRAQFAFGVNWWNCCCCCYAGENSVGGGGNSFTFTGVSHSLKVAIAFIRRTIVLPQQYFYDLHILTTFYPRLWRHVACERTNVCLLAIMWKWILRGRKNSHLLSRRWHGFLYWWRHWPNTRTFYLNVCYYTDKRRKTTVWIT